MMALEEKFEIQLDEEGEFEAHVPSCISWSHLQLACSSHP